jgi:ubiquinone/menaquinone biosynthesis C-methylase UbiE
LDRDPNRATYSRAETVRHYARNRTLQKPEETILALLGDALSGARMLDLGVGTGRTTLHFAPRVKAYVGADYSPEMIEYCRRHFAERPRLLEFAVANATNLAAFASESFDFVFFAFNGLDYIIRYEDRLRALHEIHRVCRPGAWFCMSSHNINSIDHLFKITIRKNVFAMLRNVRDVYRLRTILGDTDSLKRQAYSVITDGAHNFELQTYYGQPALQIQQLTDAGFTDVRIFDLPQGAEITTSEGLRLNTDFYLYYLCRRA